MYTDSGRRTQRAGRPARAVHPGDRGRQREDRDLGGTSAPCSAFWPTPRATVSPAWSMSCTALSARLLLVRLPRRRAAFSTSPDVRGPRASGRAARAPACAVRAPGTRLDQPETAPTPRKPGDLPGLRIIRLREAADRAAAAHLFGVPFNEETQQRAPGNGCFSGLVQHSDTVFYGASHEPADRLRMANWDERVRRSLRSWSVDTESRTASDGSVGGCLPTRSRNRQPCLLLASLRPRSAAAGRRQSLRRSARCPRRSRSHRAGELSPRCPRRPARSTGPSESEPTRHLSPRTDHRTFVRGASAWDST